MFPVLFHIPGINFDLPGYGVAMMIGFLLSIMWAARRALRSGADPDVILDCGFIALIGGVIGSRAMYVVHYWDQFAYRGSTAQVIWAIIDVRKGGLEVYGGFICVVVLVLLYLWRKKHSIRWYLDIAAPSAALGMAMGRVGCFLNGCCWGVVAHQVPWAVQFPYGSPAMAQQWTDRVPGAELPQQVLAFGQWPDGSTAVPLPRETLWATDRELDAARKAYEGILAKAKEQQVRLDQTTDPEERLRILKEVDAATRAAIPPSSHYLEYAAPLMSKYNLGAAELRQFARQHLSLPVHPTQLYSVGALGLLAWLLGALYWRRRFDGQVICTLLFVEPPTRFVLELLRADNPVDTAGFTVSQFLSLCISAVGLLGLFWLRRLPARSPRAAVWEPPPEEQPVPKKTKRPLGT